MQLPTVVSLQYFEDIKELYLLGQIILIWILGAILLTLVEYIILRY